jgi:hypothetical protein
MNAHTRAYIVRLKHMCGYAHSEIALPFLLQSRREWVNKPDGTMITAEAAKASTRAFFKPGAGKGINYYEVLQVCWYAVSVSFGVGVAAAAK